MKRYFIYALALFTYAGISQADDLELSLEQCLSEPAQVTDMEFIAPHYALMTTQSGDVYLFRGCNRDTKKVGHVDVAKTDWTSGLYSIAVPYNYFWTQTVYLYFTAEKDGELVTRLSSFKLNLFDDDGLTDEKVLIEIDQPYASNNGGALEFGPDGLLYLGVGDGGSKGDPDNNAQNVKNLLGSILRIKPDTDSKKGYTIPDGNLQESVSKAKPEIFAYGVRNPWKITFNYDGSMILADIGEDTIEEINILPPKMMNNKEINFGWNIKEGDNCFNDNAKCSKADLVDPVYQYQHGKNGNSITGGEIYYLNNKEYYLFADFMTGMIGALDLDDPSETALQDENQEGNWVTFARDPFGRVYVSDYAGKLYSVNLK
jgi:glucose/arabinose dehydrogenase